MEDYTLWGIKNFDVVLALSVLVFFALVEIVGGFIDYSKRSKQDWLTEMVSFVQLSVLIKPAIVGAAIGLGMLLFPESTFAWRGTTLWIALPVYLLVDDVMQYWYHRKAHEWEWLWKLHRPHHAAKQMGLMAAYRNAALYYAVMPNLWWGGIMTFLGFGYAVALGLVLKQIVVIGAHSEVKWDRFMYNNKWLHPLAWVVERTISTPATHFAHHGMTERDGVSVPNGNFSNMFFFWDLMFGTALITRKYPTEMGLENDPHDSWMAHLYWPFIKSNKEGSEIGRSYKKEKTIHNKPATVELEPGRYLYCRCGFSGNQPFCDGSHHGTKFKPLAFEVKRKTKVKLCNCKMTNAAPFCDNSHISMDLSAQANGVKEEGIKNESLPKSVKKN